MATNPSSESPSLLDNTWMNQSASDRLRSIELLRKQGEGAQPALLHIARTDEYVEVRCGAINHVHDIEALQELQSDAAVREVASQQYNRLIAGAAESPLSETERIALVDSAPIQNVKQIALLAKSKPIGSAASARIHDPVDLVDLALYAVSAHVRKLAAQQIEDPKTMRELLNKVRDKDKTVSKVLEQRLTKIAQPQTQDSAVAVTAATDATGQTVAPESAAADLTPAESTASEPAAAEASAKPKPKKAPKPQPVLDPVAELPRIEQQLGSASHKHTDALNAMRNTLNKLRKMLGEETSELHELANRLHETLNEKLEKNRAHQEHLQQVTLDLLGQLQQALDAGQSHDALPTWDKIQGNISNTGGKIRAALQKQANTYKEKLNELRDWKAFAATEKKKELIAQMQHLIDSKMHAADRSKHISKMHQDWKTLGRSNQNEQLWREFKKLSDKAYEPCKEYFKQRKQQMAANYSKRREICEQLEAELARLGDSEPNIGELNKLLNAADKEWKAHAPIEQSKVKALQKRYYAAINQLRKTRKHSVRENANQKQEFIAQANALAESEDNQQAMQEAKRLQQEWKKIGPTSFKEDRKYWEDFRAACDRIFSKRNQEAATQRDNLKESESALTALLHSMEAIFTLDDEAFRQARNEYQTLAQQFSNALNPRQRNQLKRLQEQFNGLKRKLDSRYKSLPDKKQLQLKNSVLEKARFLQEIEDKLLTCENDAQFFEIRNAIDNTAWQELPDTGDRKYDEALLARLQRIQQAPSLAALRDIADECATKARELCIDLEIRANLDTPKEDQGLRMQIQLDQLKHGFGKLKPDPKENSAYAMDIELQSYCLGPLEAKMQQQMSQRLEGAIRKLL